MRYLLLMLTFPTVLSLFISMENYIAMYSKHNTTVTAVTNRKHIAPCNGKKLPYHLKLRLCYKCAVDLNKCYYASYNLM